MKIVQWILAACFLTASFDIFLVLNVGGSVRISQLLMVPVVLAGFGCIVQRARILWPRGATALTLWVLVQFLLLPRSANAAMSFPFLVVLAFSAAGIVALVQLYGLSDHIETLLKIYLAAFVAMAVFGLVQFLTPLLGLPGLLVQQWIIPGRLARINGFTYEPSFFATYLLPGWIALVELRLSGARVVAGPRWKWATFLVTAALLLSTSKTGWLLMLLELVLRVLPALWALARGLARQLPQGTLLVPLPRSRSLGNLLRVGAVLAVVAGGLASIASPSIFLAGTGLAGNANHSYADRARSAVYTWTAIRAHPWVGLSIGGAPAAIAAQDGVTISNIAQARYYWAFPVLLEVLLASGALFVLPFLVFLYVNTFGALRLAARHLAADRTPDERALWLRALARSMVFVWLMLFADSTLLRVYLWYHFAVLAVVAYHLEFAPAPVLQPLTTRPVSGLLATLRLVPYQ